VKRLVPCGENTAGAEAEERGRPGGRSMDRACGSSHSLQTEGLQAAC